MYMPIAPLYSIKDLFFCFFFNFKKCSEQFCVYIKYSLLYVGNCKFKVKSLLKKQFFLLHYLEQYEFKAFLKL